MYLNYTSAGFLIISPDNDCHAIVDIMLETDYSEDFCLARNFEPSFVARLMEAGFLVMSAIIEFEDNDPFYILLPKLHLERSVLFFDNLYVKKSIRKFLNRYELRANAEFERIVDCCVKKHGGDWLTPPLVDCIKAIRQKMEMKRTSDPTPFLFTIPPLLPTEKAYPASFGLYRNDELIAGEFGVVCGNVYTSYSGYYDEDNAGTVQIILTTRYLEEHGFSFFDLGMPLDYKTEMGAANISPQEFVRLFRTGKPSKYADKFGY